MNNKVLKITSLPVIACGGAGTNEHFLKAFKDNDINALSAGNFFHFKENAYPNLKNFLKRRKRSEINGNQCTILQKMCGSTTNIVLVAYYDGICTGCKISQENIKLIGSKDLNF